MTPRSATGSILGYTLLSVGCLVVALFVSANLLEQCFLRVESGKRRLALEAMSQRLEAFWANQVRGALQAGAAAPYAQATETAAVDFLGEEMERYGLSGYSTPTTPPLMAGQEFTKDGAWLDGVGDLWRIDHEVTAEYQLSFEDARGRSSLRKTWATTTREIPLSQIGLAAMAPLDLSDLPFSITVNGIAFLPMGTLGSPASPNLSCSRLVSLPGSSAAVTASTRHLRASLSAGFSAGAYSPMGSGTNSPVQALRARGVMVAWDGVQITSGAAPAGIAVQEHAGEKRLVIDLTVLPLTNAKTDDGEPEDNVAIWTIDCTTPLAKGRGVVVLGDDGVGGRPRDMLITNGAVWLSGTHASPLAVASSYGAVVFDSSSPSPSWAAHLSVPSRPAQVMMSSQIGAGELVDTTAPGSAALGVQARSANLIEIAAALPNGATVGFTPAAASGPDLYIHYDEADGLHLWVADEAGVPQNLQTIPAPGLSEAVSTLRYDRAAGLVTATVNGASVALDLSPGMQRRFETAGVAWTAPLPSFAVSIRSGGTQLHGVGGAVSPTIQGLVVGGELGGTIEHLAITETAGEALLSLTERALIFAPRDAL